MGTEFQFHKTKYGGHGGDGRMTMTIYLIPLSWTLRNGKFYVTCIFKKEKQKKNLKTCPLEVPKRKIRENWGRQYFLK